MLSKKFCPDCGSEEVEMIAGGTTGAWMCKKCGYTGSIFPEREIVGRDATMKKQEEREKIAKEISDGGDEE